jgi:hypothetical protein
MEYEDRNERPIQSVVYRPDDPTQFGGEEEFMECSQCGRKLLSSRIGVHMKVFYFKFLFLL